MANSLDSFPGLLHDVAEKLKSMVDIHIAKKVETILRLLSDEHSIAVGDYELYGDLKEGFDKLETADSDSHIDEIQKALIDAFLSDIKDHLPGYARLLNANQRAEKAKLEKRHALEKENLMKFGGDSVESNEISTKLLDAAHIDQLIENNSDLNSVALGQLKSIRELIEQYPNHKIQSKRVSVRNGLVEIDGVILPTKKDKERPESITNDNVLHTTYPDQAKALLMFAADIIGSTFHFGDDANRSKLQTGELSNNESNALVSILDNRGGNRVVMGVLCEILGYAYTIYLGVDSNGSVPYVGAISPDCLCSAGRCQAGKLTGHPISFSQPQ